jgi:signal peptide peptidase sppA, 67K type
MKYILSFFSSLTANLLSLFVFFFVIPIIGIVVIVGMVNSQLNDPFAEKSNNAAVVINLADPVTDSASVNDLFSNIVNNGSSISIYSLCSKIAAAAKDKSNRKIFITGSFENSAVLPSYAQIAEIRAALENYKKSKKEIVAYLENPSMRDYFLASAATKVVVNPFSELEFNGLGGNSIFFGRALKKYGVDVKIVKVGALKSFGEMFTSDKMSPLVRENSQALLDSVWNSVVAKISKSRNIPVEKLLDIAEKSAVVSAQDAKALGLADSLMYQDEVIAYMKSQVGNSGASFRQTSIISYMPESDFYADTVEVVYMDGEITDSYHGANVIDSSRYPQNLRMLRELDHVKAVVLRINSGGGSAYVSEVIRREVELLAKKKPVVVSIGGVAASGAYWISTAANKIFADSESITGSIGVFSVMLSAQKFADGFGVTFDGVKTSPMADIGTIARAPSQAEIERVQKLTDKVYEKFIGLVSKSRRIPLEDVKKFADGSIYSGRQALSMKLVDAIGGLDAAIREAAKMAKITEFDISESPEINPVKDFIDSLSAGDAPFAKIRALKPIIKAKKTVDAISSKPQVYARSPFDFVIE